MTFENGWVKFFREQYPTGSRIKLRDLKNTRAPRKMGTLESIEDDGTFTVRWDNGDVGHLMPGTDSFTVLQPEPMTLKLYMPLTAEVMHYDYWEGGDEDHSDLADREILAIEDEIVSAMVRNHTEEEAERGIMHWYGEDNSVDDKVRSVFFTAEEREGKLWGVAECRVVGELTPEELAELKDYISGQASDVGAVGVIVVDGVLPHVAQSIIRQKPYRIFVVTMGNDSQKALDNLYKMMDENPAWGSLEAVAEGRIHLMDRRLFHNKPNADWAVAYEKLSEILHSE